MEKNCKTCKRKCSEVDPIYTQCVWTDDYEFWEPADISPDLCCGITDSVVSQGGKREKNEMGDDLCKYCTLVKKGVYGVKGGFVAGCEGSRCDEAYETYCFHFRNSSLLPKGKREMFEKVYVTTVEDLPKDEGYYFVMHIEDDGKDVYYFLPSEDDLIREWITKVEWWLRPVE